MKKNLFFPKRIAEPKQMEKAEMLVFEKLALTNYRRWVLPLVVDACNLISARHAKILDVGCGPGLLVKGFAEYKKNWDVVGADISSHALALARKNCKGLKNSALVKSTVYKLTFKDDEFDLVVCKDSFHHFDKPDKALKEMLRVLRPGGILYLQDLRRDLPQYLLNRAIPADNPIKKLQFYSARAAYTKKEVEELLENLKIKKYRIRTQHINNAAKKTFFKLGVLNKQLKEGFQARFLLTATKS